MSETKGAIYVDGPVGEVSDGHHTFNELYEHRCALFVALCMATDVRSWKSRTHDDGKGIAGWFIAGLELPTGVITYHLPDRLWFYLPSVELERAPKWDGHTSKDVVERLLRWVRP